MMTGTLLTGEEAARMLVRLIAGEKGSRSYYTQLFGAHGYYFEPLIRQWIVFDNRMDSCFIEVCNRESEARQLLIDGTELLAA